MIKFLFLQKENINEWREFVYNHPKGDIFHLPEWAEVYRRTYGFLNAYSLVYSDGKLIGILPIIRVRGLFKNYLSTPPAGFLLEDEEKYIIPIIDYIKHLKNEYEAVDIEIFNFDFSFDSWYSNNESVLIKKTLPGNEKDLLNDIGSKRRNMIRKAEKNNLKVLIESADYDSIEIFYDIYSTNYRDLGTPVHSKDYFLNQAELLSDKLKIMLVYMNSKPIGAMWLHKFRNTISDPEAAALRKYFYTGINDYMYFKAFIYTIENGITIFNMGRSQKNSGTYNFKISWGNCIAEDHTVIRLLEGREIKMQKEKYKFFIIVWQHFPRILTNFFGPWIRKNIRLE